VKKIVHENIRFAVGASPGFRTLEIVDVETGDCYVFPMESTVAAQLSRHLMEGDPDPEQLKAEGTHERVVTLGR